MFALHQHQSNYYHQMNILVLGGSQAAKIFAENLPIIFKNLEESKIPLKVFQQCQKNQTEQMAASNSSDEGSKSEIIVDQEKEETSDESVEQIETADIMPSKLEEQVIGK